MQGGYKRAGLELPQFFLSPRKEELSIEETLCAVPMEVVTVTVYLCLILGFILSENSSFLILDRTLCVLYCLGCLSGIGSFLFGWLCLQYSVGLNYKACLFHPVLLK